MLKTSLAGRNEKGRAFRAPGVPLAPSATPSYSYS
jgi:hypothetical protein